MCEAPFGTDFEGCWFEYFGSVFWPLGLLAFPLSLFMCCPRSMRSIYASRMGPTASLGE